MTEPTRKIPRQATSAVAFPGEPPAEDDPLLAFEPYRHKQPRANTITPELQRRFVAQLAATGVVKVAARHIGKSLEALYNLRALRGAEAFAAAWDVALVRATHRLEDMASERALIGTRTPIVSHGKVLGHWDKPDNVLLRFLLQHRLPERYGIHNLGPGHAVYDSIADKERAAAEARFAERERALQTTLASERKRAELAERRLAWFEVEYGEDDEENEDVSMAEAAKLADERAMLSAHYPDFDAAEIDYIIHGDDGDRGDEFEPE